MDGGLCLIKLGSVKVIKTSDIFNCAEQISSKYKLESRD